MDSARALVAACALAACASTQTQIGALPLEQRTYFDAIRATGKQSDAHALDIVRKSRALTAADRDAVIAAEAAVAALAPPPFDAAAVQIEIAFDGTWDDRSKMPFATNPALLDAMFDGPKHYETGVGTTTASRLLGGAAGAGLHHRIDRAYEWLVDQVGEVARTKPGAPVVLVVTGFSRGAATARAFVNVLDHRGVPGHATPRIGALILFDTVGSVGMPGTNWNPGLDLAIPANAEHVLHITARDEKRHMFPLSSALDPSRPDDARVVEIALPGAHSDIGGSYPNAYSRIALRMAHAFLARLGWHVAPLADVPDAVDPSLRLHDSGGNGPRAIYQSRNPR